MKQLIIGAVTNAVLMGLAITFMRLWLGGFEKRVSISIEELKSANKELWEAVNKHGHKGLDSNNSRVTR